MANHTPLRFVILANSLHFPKWQAACIRDVVDSGLAVPVGIVINNAYDGLKSRQHWRVRWSNKKYAIWRLFCRFYVDRVSTAEQLEDLGSYLSGVPAISTRSHKTGRFMEALDDEALNFVRGRSPNFVLRFGFGILSGDILKVAPYGVWSYHHGDPAKFRGQPPGFWEIYTGSKVTGTVLQILGTDLDAGQVLHEGFFQTKFHSYARSRDAVYFGSCSWVRRTCAHIKEIGWPVQSSRQKTIRGSVWKRPTNIQMIWFFIMTAMHFCRTHVTYRLFSQEWNCAVVPASIETVAGLRGDVEQKSALAKAQWMACPPGMFIADPFGYKINEAGDIRVIFELFDKAKSKGEIASVLYSREKFGPIVRLLSAPTHLSYPFIVEAEDNVFVMPEHSADKKTRVYRLDLSGKIEPGRTIFDKCAWVDPTIVQWNQKFWLFALDEFRSSNSDLNVYYSDCWDGPWTAHPLNPVKTDIRSARPAGTPFYYGGKLYRPAQDCSGHYGSRIIINEIISLSESKFIEQPVGNLNPVGSSSYQYGLHTLSSAGRYTLIDGARKRLSLW